MSLGGSCRFNGGFVVWANAAPVIRQAVSIAALRMALMAKLRLTCMQRARSGNRAHRFDSTAWPEVPASACRFDPVDPPQPARQQPAALGAAAAVFHEVRPFQDQLALARV